MTATSEGGGAIWYNPAGLAHLGGGRVDVSVNGYAVRFGGNPTLSGGEGATVQTLGRLDLNVVPTALSITQKFGRVGLGIGVFVPTQGVNILRTLVREDASETEGLEFSTNLYERYQSYHAGPSIGFSPTEELDLGASLLATYQTLLGLGSLGIVARTPAGAVILNQNYLNDAIQVGAQFVLGAKWRPRRDWFFGVTVRTPALRIAQILQTIESETTVVAGSTEPSSSTRFRDDFGLRATVISPFRFHFGAAHTVDRYLVSADMSLMLPFTDANLSLRQRATWNGRVGIRRDVTPGLAIGGGFFTDMSTFETPREFGESQVNYYGVTAALDLKNPYLVSAKGSTTLEKPAELVFGTSVALSYALGVGTVMSGLARYDAMNGLSLENLRSDVVAHEITLHIGSTLAD